MTRNIKSKIKSENFGVCSFKPLFLKNTLMRIRQSMDRRDQGGIKTWKHNRKKCLFFFLRPIFHGLKFNWHWYFFNVLMEFIVDHLRAEFGFHYTHFLSCFQTYKSHYISLKNTRGLVPAIGLFPTYMLSIFYISVCC